MFDNQHDCQAFVGCLATQLPCVSLDLPQQVFALLWLLSWSRSPFSSCRSIAKHPSDKSSLTSLLAPCYFLDPEVADLDLESPFFCGLDTEVIVTLALVVVLRYLRSSRAESAALRVCRVRLNDNEDVWN